MLGVVVGAALVAGVVLGSLAVVPLPAMAGLALAAVIVGGLWWRWGLLRLASLAALALLLGMARYYALAPPPGERSLAFYHDRGVVRLEGEVVEEPTLRDQSTDLRLSARHLWLGEQPVEVEGGLLLRAARPAPASYGDELEVVGELEAPPDYPGFAYHEYLARQGVYSYMAYPRVVGVRPASGFRPLVALSRWKESLGLALSRSLPEPEAALAQGILLGVRASIPADLQDALARTGTSHIVAISGFNVAIIAGLSLRLGRRWLGLRSATAAALVSIAVFAAFVGPQPSVVRAALMGGLVVLASYFGRPSDAGTALALVAAAMALHDPQVLWDISFQLSFLATAGLVAFAPALQGWLARLPRLISDNLAVTLAAQIATLPISVVNFGQVSFLAPPVNLVVLPLVGPIMLFSALAALVGQVWQPLAAPFAWAAYLPLFVALRAIEVGGSLPLATIQPGPLPAAFPWLYYAALGSLLGLRVCFPSTRPDPAPILNRLPLRPTLLGLVLAAVVAWTAFLQAPDGRLHVTFLDVGQGDAILIRTPAGQQVLVDGGPGPVAAAEALGRQLPFWDRSLDLVILTHPDDDHLVGLLEVLQRYDVAQALEPGCEEASPTYQRWRRILDSRGVRRSLAHEGQQIPLGDGLRLRVLYPQGVPDTHECRPDLNSYSVVLRLESPELSALLTGDLEDSAQPELLRREGEAVASQVLKVPHHGAGQALSPEFLERVAPEVAIVSVGQGNRYGHPAAETLDKLKERGVRVYRTDLDGTVEVIAGGEGKYEVKTYGR